MEIGGEEQGAGEIVAELLGEPRIAAAGNEAFPRDDMRLDRFHHEQRQFRIVAIDGGNSVRAMALLDDQRPMFEIDPTDRKRPAFADHPDIGECLLGDDATGRPVDTEDGVHVAVADLADHPAGLVAAKSLRDPGLACQNVGEDGPIEDAEFCGDRKAIGHMSIYDIGSPACQEPGRGSRGSRARSLKQIGQSRSMRNW